MNKSVNANQEFQSDFLSVSAARAAISDLIRKTQEHAKLKEAIDIVPLKESLGRIVAGDILSPIDVPPTDNSAMDGFAFNSNELDSNQDQIHLRIIATVYAGQTHSPAIEVGGCIKVMTGAMMPANCDTVIPQESTTSNTNGLISFSKDVIRPGENRRLRG